MRYQEFDPPLLPGDPQYLPPGRNLTAHDGTVEGDCPAVCESLSYSCTLDEGHTGRHIAHGAEIVDGLFVEPMYAEWDDEDTGEEVEGMSSEKKPNPHEVSLSKFLGALARPVTRGYVYLNNGQIIREDTRQRWQAEGRM